ncbi:MAG: hypothetical protein HGA96_17855, partial [Desulfobulbaceae bacterium]|nr:hypothetical protein [Desulfobulbaceae bacterium]
MAPLVMNGVIYEKNMNKEQVKCPHCKSSYEIETYSLGFLDAHEMRCDSCSITLFVSYYSSPITSSGSTVIYAKLYGNELTSIEKALKPCICGG